MHNLLQTASVKKILIFFIIKTLVVITALYGAFFVFVNAKGKDLVLDAIKRRYGAQAQLDAFVMQFPFTFELINFNCGDISFRKASVSLSITKPSEFPLSLNNVTIDQLFIKLTKNAQGWSIAPSQPLTKTQPATIQNHQPTSIEFFSIKKLFCKNASVELEYKPQKSINFDNVTLNISNFVYPELPKLSFDLVASLRSPSGNRDMPDMIKANGWIDYLNKNMDAKLMVRNFDYMAYSNYYPEVWKPKNLRVKEAVLSLDADFKSENNNLRIDTLFSLDKIEFIEGSDEGSGARVRLLKDTIAYFQKGNEKPQYRFRTHTKMDSPEQFLPALLADLRTSVPIGPAIISEIAIEKTKQTVSKGVEEVVNKATETITKGVEGVKKLTVDTAIGTITNTVGAVKDIITPSSSEQQKLPSEGEEIKQ